MGKRTREHTMAIGADETVPRASHAPGEITWAPTPLRALVALCRTPMPAAGGGKSIVDRPPIGAARAPTLDPASQRPLCEIHNMSKISANRR
jgi:hypothetical protein